MITHEFTTIIGDIPEGWRSVELRRLLLSQGGFKSEVQHPGFQ